jgi:hypothetical protein
MSLFCRNDEVAYLSAGFGTVSELCSQIQKIDASGTKSHEDIKKRLRVSSKACICGRDVRWPQQTHCKVE